MARISIVGRMVFVVNLLALSSQSDALGIQAPAAPKPGGFRTDRLSERQARLWNAICRIVLARDAQSHPLYPTLHQLWDTVEQSGHTVFIELVTDKERASNIAGETVIENLDPAGRTHTFRVTLFIPTIDRVYPREQQMQEGMSFVPFSGLSHKARYAKVLGHELAHIAKAVNDQDYLHLVHQLCVEQRLIAAGVGEDGKPQSHLLLKERSDRVWPLVLESERPAILAEAEIYRELLNSKDTARHRGTLSIGGISCRFGSRQ